MKVQNIQSNNFKSGLTRQILENEAIVNPKQIENYFRMLPNKGSQNFSNIDLKDNKAYAIAFRYCAELFKNFSQKHNYSKFFWRKPCVFPTDIIVYREDELANCLSLFTRENLMHSFNTLTNNISDMEHNIIKNLKATMSVGTIFVPCMFNSLKDLNENANISKVNNLRSSGHFLHLFVHEWLHSIVNQIIHHKTRSCFNGNYEATQKHIRQQQLNNHESDIVYNLLGEYASRQKEGQYNDVVAEAWTKFICDSLDKDCIHFKKDPVEEMRKTPKEFQEILKKVSTIVYYSKNIITGGDRQALRFPVCFHPKIVARKNEAT